jgi:hypothetical protein
MKKHLWYLRLGCLSLLATLFVGCSTIQPTNVATFSAGVSAVKSQTSLAFQAVTDLTSDSIIDYAAFLHHTQTIAITGRSYRLKDHAAIAGKEAKNKKSKSKSNEPSTAEPAS